ncbi:hypothetical protein H4Q26_004648 [Puccinia striiformis f. sp. tritici PST-130]|nr:hypothetical protein H4Q26_004648 [Puccinia striiformis f. sp. tritici PST-130]
MLRYCATPKRKDESVLPEKLPGVRAGCYKHIAAKGGATYEADIPGTATDRLSTQAPPGSRSGEDDDAESPVDVDAL